MYPGMAPLRPPRDFHADGPGSRGRTGKITIGSRKIPGEMRLHAMGEEGAVFARAEGLRLVLRFLNTATYSCVPPGAQAQRWVPRTGRPNPGTPGSRRGPLGYASDLRPLAAGSARRDFLLSETGRLVDPPASPRVLRSQATRQWGNMGGAAKEGGFERSFSGRQVKRRLAGASQVERRSGKHPSRMRSESRPRGPAAGRGNALGHRPYRRP
jgi:hypothetical protein